jgi:hypothetical protein
MMELAMPWRESRVMDERMAFIVDWQREDYGMSRRTGYKLRDRFLAEGMAGLGDRRSGGSGGAPGTPELGAEEDPGVAAGA